MPCNDACFCSGRNLASPGVAGKAGRASARILTLRPDHQEHFAKYRRNRKKKATSLARKASGGGANEGSKAGDAANGVRVAAPAPGC